MVPSLNRFLPSGSAGSRHTVEPSNVSPAPYFAPDRAHSTSTTKTPPNRGWRIQYCLCLARKGRRSALVSVTSRSLLSAHPRSMWAMRQSPMAMAQTEGCISES